MPAGLRRRSKDSLISPKAAPPRPLLGEFTRVVIIEPFLLIYDYESADDLLTLLRFVHGKTDLKEEILWRS
jgi:hypothetical protein